MSTNFPVTLDAYAALVDNTDDVLAAHPNDRGDAIEALEAKVGVDGSAVTTSLDYKVNNFFATGRKVYLYENTAPTGWSITAVTDKVLAVKGGADAYNISGGTAGGTWTQPNHTHTGPSHTHIVSKGTYSVTNYAANGYLRVTQTAWNTNGITSDITTGSGGTGVTGGGATAATYRPSAAVGIICTKA